MSAPNWLGLLKWSLSYSDGTSPSPAKPMSDEDKQFLEKVMKECVKDEPAKLNEIILEFMKLLAIDVTTTPSNTNINVTQNIPSNEITPDIISNVVNAKDKIENCLYELDEIIDQIDMAQIFVKFGGLECLIRLLEIKQLDIQVRWHIAAVIGELS